MDNACNASRAVSFLHNTAAPSACYLSPCSIS